jgi:hypothetical protein
MYEKKYKHLQYKIDIVRIIIKILYYMYLIVPCPCPVVCRTVLIWCVIHSHARARAVLFAGE